ncbi:YxlC family protein [Niallia sp. XMNu-256]|uniref:YxlC family protein n=1 Tax=Niallia sp. XMNu-256 TaxID=3082444 RepID=UPI0030D564B8
MKKGEEQTPIQKLQQDWKQLDELAGNPSISAIEMKRQIAEYKEKQKKRLYKELMIFYVTALCILGFFITSFLRAPGLFIAIEILAMIIGPIVYYILVKRKKKERNILG